MGADVRTTTSWMRPYSRVSRFGALDIWSTTRRATSSAQLRSCRLGMENRIDIDLNGTFHGCRAAYPYLKGRSTADHHQHHYDAGRDRLAGGRARRRGEGGNSSLSRTLAVEWGPDKILVTRSPPAHGDTEGVRRIMWSRSRRLEAKKTALGRFGRKEDIGECRRLSGVEPCPYITARTWLWTAADG